MGKNRAVLKKGYSQWIVTVLIELLLCIPKRVLTAKLWIRQQDLKRDWNLSTRDGILQHTLGKETLYKYSGGINSYCIHACYARSGRRVCVCVSVFWWLDNVLIIQRLEELLQWNFHRTKNKDTSLIWTTVCCLSYTEKCANTLWDRGHLFNRDSSWGPKGIHKRDFSTLYYHI